MEMQLVAEHGPAGQDGRVVGMRGKQGVQVTPEGVVLGVHQRPVGVAAAPGGGSLGHVVLLRVVVESFGAGLAGDADGVADRAGLAEHLEHQVSDVGARDGEPAAGVAPDRRPVAAGQRLVS